MQVEDIVRQMRRQLGEALVNVGVEATPVFPDKLLMDYISGAALHLEVMGIGDQTYTVVIYPATITPEPSTIDGILLAARAATDLLAGDVVGQIRDGSLGVRFRSGLEEISTVEAAKKVSEQVRDLRRWFEQVKTLKLSKRTDQALRMQ